MAAATFGLRFGCGHHYADGGFGTTAGAGFVEHHDLAFLAGQSVQIDTFGSFIGGEAATEDRLRIGTERRTGGKRHRIILEQFLVVTVDLETKDDFGRLVFVGLSV